MIYYLKAGKAGREVGLSSSEAPRSVVDVPTHVRT